MPLSWPLIRSDAGIPENDSRSDGAGDKIAALVHDGDSTGHVLVFRLSHRRSD